MRAFLFALVLVGCGDSSRRPAGAVVPADVARVEFEPGDPALRIETSDADHAPFAATSGESETSRRIAIGDLAPRHVMFGRVVDARRGRLPDGQTRVAFYGEGVRRFADVASNGRFRIALDDVPDSGTFRVQFEHERSFLRTQWRDPESVDLAALTPRQRAGNEEFVLGITEQRRGIARGIAVDAVTGAPLPHLRFTLVTDNNAHERPPIEPIDVETDEAGLFTTSAEVREERVRIRVPRGEPQPVDVEPVFRLPDGPDDAPWRLEFRVGPMVELDLQPQVADVSEFTAWVIPDGAERAKCTIALRKDPVTGRIWLRAPDVEIPASEVVSIAVGANDGLQFGATSFAWGAASRASVSVALEPTAVLVLDIMEELPGGMLVKPGRGGESMSVKIEPRSPPPHVDMTRAFRAHSRRWLPGGEYSVLIATRVHAPIARSVQLVPGQETTVVGQLRFEERSRRILGTARTQSGAPVPDFTVSISLRDRPDREWKVDYTDGGYMCGFGIDLAARTVEGSVPPEVVFEIASVPPGEIVASVGSGDGPFSIEQRSVGDSGDVELDIVALDGVGTPGFGFRFATEVEGAGGLILFDSRVRDGEAPMWGWVRSGAIVDTSDPNARDFEWAVMAQGYRTVYGTQRDFVAEGGGRYFARIDFVPGFSTRLVVHDTNGEPIGAVEIVADGEPVGETDASGWIEVVLDEPPMHIGIAPTALGSTHPPPRIDEDQWDLQPWNEFVLPRR